MRLLFWKASQIQIEAMEKDSEYKIFISQIYVVSSRSELSIKTDPGIKQVMSKRQF